MPPRHHKRRNDEDEVIDLTDRLAPYDDSALRPMERRARAPSVSAEPKVWTPLEFDFPYRTGERLRD